MGVVYLAHDVKLDREVAIEVAIKVLPPHLAGTTEVRERFLREARTAARLSHPNIVAIHRADEIDSRVFFVMGRNALGVGECCGSGWRSAVDFFGCANNPRKREGWSSKAAHGTPRRARGGGSRVDRVQRAAVTKITLA
jgi:hypothetical protein